MTPLTARYEIPQINMADLYARLEKLNKKAKKLGARWINLAVIGQESREVRVNGKKSTVLCNIVELTGEAPKLDGWTFIGTLDHTVADNMGNKAGVVMKAIPGETLPEEFRHDDGTCDHCRARRRRNQTFVVRHEDGRILRVGRQCLRDFLGHVDPHLIAQIAAYLCAVRSVIEDCERSDGTFANILYVQDYLAWVSAHIRTYGWRSGGEAFRYGGSSTAQDATGSMLSDTSRDRHGVVRTDEDFKLADDAIEWIRDLREKAEEGDLNDYMHNLTVVCASDVFHAVHSGIIASLIATYQRAMERELKRQRRLNLAQTSDYVGKPKEKLTLTLMVISTKQTAGNWGVKTVVSLTDGQNAFTWFATGVKDFEDGATYKVKATVKNHGIFNEVKTTYLTRLEVIEKVTEAA